MLRRGLLPDLVGAVVGPEYVKIAVIIEVGKQGTARMRMALDTERTRTLLTEALVDESDSMVRHAIESGLQMGE